MKIDYLVTKEFKEEQLFQLFNSVHWESAKFSKELVIAMKNMDCVISAWHKDKLIGLMTAMSDGVLTVYFHYLLVDPEYHNHKIGKTLVERMLSRYKDYYRKVLNAYEERQGFYESCGFAITKGVVPMNILNNCS